MSKKKGTGTLGAGGSRPCHTKGGDCCQCCKQRCILLACRCKRPCCVGELLRLEVAHASLCGCCQCFSQRYILLACCCSLRNRPCWIGEFLWCGVAYVSLGLHWPAQRCKKLAEPLISCATCCSICYVGKISRIQLSHVRCFYCMVNQRFHRFQLADPFLLAQSLRWLSWQSTKRGSASR